MDSKTRAERAAKARQKTNTNTSTSSASTSNFNSNGQSISIPKISQSTFDKKSLDNMHIANNVTVDMQNMTTNVTVPGIDNIDINSISERLHGGEFHYVTDIKNPDIPEDKQASKTEMERAIAIFERAINYEQIAQKANTYVGEQFKTLASKIKAYKQGVIAATDLEGLKQQIFDFLKAQKVTNDKGLGYVEQSHKSATIQAGVVYTVAENEAILEKKRIKANKAFEEAKHEGDGFDDWLTTLKGKSDKKIGAD